MKQKGDGQHSVQLATYKPVLFPSISVSLLLVTFKIACLYFSFGIYGMCIKQALETHMWPHSAIHCEPGICLNEAHRKTKATGSNTPPLACALANSCIQIAY